MRVPFHLVEERRARLAQLVEQHRYLPVQELCRQMKVSEATIRRDLAVLEREKKITRTYGGVLSEFNDRFPSFRERQEHSSAAKRKIASSALPLILPNQTCFFDSGTTIFKLAEALCENPVTPLIVVTSNLPVGEMLSSIPEIQVFQLAGQLLHRQSVLLGETAQRSLEFWRFDIAFLSAEGMNAAGLWNSSAEIVDQQKVALRRSSRNVFCIDKGKLNRRATHFLARWSEVDLLLTDATLGQVQKAGIPLREEAFRSALSKASGSPRGGVGSPDEGETLPVHFL